jgi:antitoxin ParD1/3/4
MDVSLTSQLEEFVRQQVASGRYTSASEVVGEALRLMQERERTDEEKLAALRADLRAGMGSGPPVDADDVFRRLDEHMAQHPHGRSQRA